MSRAALDALVKTVTVEPLGDDLFEGVGSANDGVEATYGGHFLGQATAAALATIEPERHVHSLHGYFLRAGQPGKPYSLRVERIRDGRSFCSRRVQVSQDDGRIQFELLLSAAVPEDGPTLDPEPPTGFADLPDPTSLPTQPELMAGLDPLPLPEAWALRDYGLDIRTVNAPWSPDGPSPLGGIRLWVRADGTLGNDHHLQAAVMAYQSDESLADNIAVPWGATWGSPGVIFVSLDHAMWFHRPFDLNDWLLVDQQPITVGGGRGLATGNVYDRHGSMVVSFTQEALLRLTPNFLEAADTSVVRP